LGKYTDILTLTLDTAQRAAEYIRSVRHPPQPATWGLKGTSDFVTQVDRESESLIAEALLREYPDSAIMGEELTPDAFGEQNGLLWIVDPLDGTTNFLHGYPAYAVSIAAMINGTLAVGVVVDVPHNIVYHATAGGGAWRGKRQLEVSSTSDPALALIGTGFPFKALDQLPQYLRNLANILCSTSGIRRAGSAALDLVDVSSGQFDGFWELSLAPWDVAAGTLLVREAGGVVTDTDGGSDVVHQGPIVAGNLEIQPWLLEVLAR
jgi:myo-inositol-1(or 4)-monophosphatase